MKDIDFREYRKKISDDLCSLLDSNRIHHGGLEPTSNQEFRETDRLMMIYLR